VTRARANNRPTTAQSPPFDRLLCHSISAFSRDQRLDKQNVSPSRIWMTRGDSLRPRPGAKGLVIGGGLLGLEAGADCKYRVGRTVIHLLDTLMNMRSITGGCTSKRPWSNCVRVLLAASRRGCSATGTSRVSNLRAANYWKPTW